MKPFFAISLFFCLFGFSFSQELLTNGGFEEQFIQWSNTQANGAQASFTIVSDAKEGSNALNAVITTLGTNEWDVQSIHSGWSSVEGKDYTLKFWAKAANAGQIFRVVMQNTTYSHFEQVLSTEWKEYQFDFTAKENDLQMKFHFYQTGDYTLDGFSITEAQAPDGNYPLSIDLSTRHQTMVGFGGALTWYSDRILRSSAKDSLIDLLVNDLGVDIIRLKNWYYPNNFPQNKSIDDMEDANFKAMITGNKEIYEAVKSLNPNIQFLLSSWGPPSSLKSNADFQNGGTLKKQNDQFMYSELAEYYEEVLNTAGFNPDWFSFQNEQGYTAEWTSCVWRPEESADFPSYTIAFDSIYNRIKDRQNPPKMIGGEVENIATANWDNTRNNFSAWADSLKSREGVWAYGYHLYNYQNGVNSGNVHFLNNIRDNHSDKLSIMTENSTSNIAFSEYANVWNASLTEANNSGYIHWSLVWDYASTGAVFAMDWDGNYLIGENYYLLKHFSKYINAGDQRIEVGGGDANLRISGFLKPTGDTLTLVITNNSSLAGNIDLSVTDNDFSAYTTFQSVENGPYYQSLQVNNPKAFSVPPKSITTLVAVLKTPVTGDITSNSTKVSRHLSLAELQNLSNITVFDTQGNKLFTGPGSQMPPLPQGSYFIKSPQGFFPILLH